MTTMTNTPHKHAEVIHAYADGATIQVKGYDGNWTTPKYPDFDPSQEYRIKPEPPKYPQTKMSSEELEIAAQENRFAGLLPPPFHVVAERIANAAIARAVQDGQVSILVPEGRNPLSDPNKVGNTEYCMGITGQGRIFGTQKVVDYVANKLLDAPDMVPVVMLDQVASLVKMAMITEVTVSALERMAKADVIRSMSNVGLAPLVASVRKGSAKDGNTKSQVSFQFDTIRLHGHGIAFDMDGQLTYWSELPLANANDTVTLPITGVVNVRPEAN